VTTRRIMWPSPIRLKLLAFRSPHFTPDETLDFIAQFILGTEDILSNREPSLLRFIPVCVVKLGTSTIPSSKNLPRTPSNK